MISESVKKFTATKSKLFIVSGVLSSLVLSVSGLLFAIFNYADRGKIGSGLVLFAFFFYFLHFYYKCLKFKIFRIE